jgi:mannose-6-phosphate isomerase-like protein (cupin superfamily)
LEVGTHVALHWHPTEALYYVISGRAVMADIEGKTCEISAGSVIYATAGIASAHEWTVTERMQILVIRATRDPERLHQFIVDKETKRSYLEYKNLIQHGGAQFKSLY